MIHLRSISLQPGARDREAFFPFSIATIAKLGTIAFDSPVTFFVGENGSGKSTLIEALACTTEAISVGSEPLERDPSLTKIRPLASALKATWNKRTRRGFFLRAEDFFGYVRQMATSVAHYEREAERVRSENPDLAKGELDRINAPFAGSAQALQGRYGDLEARSHGEQFLDFFRARLVPGGLYLLDEPEVPLSPTRQLALLSVLKEFSEERDCQFIIATHSPILMALPDAVILSFDEVPIRAVPFDELEHVNLTRDFLNRPESFLRHL